MQGCYFGTVYMWTGSLRASTTFNILLPRNSIHSIFSILQKQKDKGIAKSESYQKLLLHLKTIIVLSQKRLKIFQNVSLMFLFVDEVLIQLSTVFVTTLIACMAVCDIISFVIYKSEVVISSSSSLSSSSLSSSSSSSSWL